MTFRDWMYPFGIGLALLMTALAISTSPASPIVLSASFGAFVVAIVLAFRGRKDKYDLSTLRDVHEKEEAREIVLEEPDDFDSVHCFHCGTVYSNKLRACPGCGRGL